MLELV